jgi:hypothetical protein
MLPNHDISTGKFMFGGFLTATAAEANARGWTPMLPTALRGIEFLICHVGGNFAYRRSTAYAACVDWALIDSGPQNFWWVTGYDGDIPIWTLDGEAAAVPVITSWDHDGNTPDAPCIGEMDVKYHDPLKSILMTYGAYYNCGGLFVRSAKMPWGPYSTEQKFFPATANSGWSGKLIHAAGSTNDISANEPTIFQSNGTTPIDFHSSGFSLGGMYGPYQTGQSTDNGNGTVSIYHYFSAFRPYQVWLGKFSMTKEPSIKSSNAIFNGGISLR